MSKQPLRPFCQRCGWRKGGPDSWNGVTCKCRHNEQPIENVDTGERFYVEVPDD